MENLEVGNYIRAGAAGIKKVTELIRNPDSSICSVIDEEGKIIRLKYIRDTNKQIMKLIKIGDYVNGKRVDRITDSSLGLEYCEECGLFAECVFKDDEIKDILTKEQFRAGIFERK